MSCDENACKCLMTWMFFQCVCDKRAMTLVYQKQVQNKKDNDQNFYFCYIINHIFVDQIDGSRKNPAKQILFNKYSIDEY